MADETPVPIPHDRTRIDVTRSAEMRYWTHKFAVSDDELLAAVAAVGDEAGKVCAFLQEEDRGDHATRH
ncbi:DUF3606 domain-containing protein [Caldimonas brevitalea]|uniref:DUF3606 domain-containing protein n=1 Tax=Caldimonas brevitalea TaxID=413882 RepID=A0A0G3BL14_9BURK|nr:DUF3606 domain-containing protein [Caldimonas brevitalea]AKJ27230.1 hypothetical protein AAW51_0539 [Caldimonas brevitalea]